MFTADQIKEVSKKVKSGKDFPQLVLELKTIGVVSYDNYVADGKTNYHGIAGFLIEGAPKYPAISVNNESSVEKLKHALSIHQQGQTDYLTFCKHAAEAGVEKWITNIDNMSVTYCDKKNNTLLMESIPTLSGNDKKI